MRILLAEDDSMLGDGLRAGLRQLGFQVDWVRDGLAAERELGSGVYAAGVLDLGLPLKDGLDVLGVSREIDRVEVLGHGQDLSSILTIRLANSKHANLVPAS